MKKINSSFIIGIFFILAGIFLCFKVMGVSIGIDSNIIWWGLVALAGVVMCINDKKLSVFPSILIVIGIWNVLKVCGLIAVSMLTLIWPIILVTIGISLMSSNKIFLKRRGTKTVTENVLVYNGVFSGLSEKVQKKDFSGLCATAVFGGVELDLRDIEISGESVLIDLTAIFGGVEIRMPDRYNVILDDSIGIFGGTENSVRTIFDENKKTIYVNTKAIFGGVDIK